MIFVICRNKGNGSIYLFMLIQYLLSGESKIDFLNIIGSATNCKTKSDCSTTICNLIIKFVKDDILANNLSEGKLKWI